ncbi:hypothetical protein BHE74_00057518 [Ensete ventricosum]|nr:hypothetical protein BHE74_00057518 [Ensete ventricosum]
MAGCKVQPVVAKTPYRGGRPLARGGRLQGQQPARGGHPRARLPVAHLQGTAVESKGGRPLARRLPTATRSAAACAGAVATAQEGEGEG